MKKNLLVLFGGESSEHEVSLISAYNVINAVDTSLYDIITVGITKDGNWYFYDGEYEKIKDGSWEKIANKKAFISPCKSCGGIIILNGDKYEEVKIDVCFPVLHGKNGEDGTVQGLLQLSGIKYVGCEVLSSSICMDKIITKIILEKNNIPQTPYVFFKKHNLDKLSAYKEEIEKNIGYPCFVKPVNAGSSVGASKVADESELEYAVKEALKHDNKVMVEKYINCREIEVAVMGNSKASVAGPGEIISESEFYDYDTKYVTNSGVKYDIPADITEKQTELIRKYALKAFEALDIKGLSRIDFFIDRDTDEIYLNEVNTIPGFTNISMYPKLFISEGTSYKELVSQLLELAVK